MSNDSTLDARSARRQRKRQVPHLVPLFSGEQGILTPAPVRLDKGEWPAGRDVPAGEGFSMAGDPLCSRRHAMFSVDSGGARVRLQDLKSRNGSFVNGKQITEQFLIDGDVVRLGDSFFLLRYAEPVGRDVELPGLLGSAPVVKALRTTIAQIGPADASVLLLGESGTGKEVSAKALHLASGRSGPFIAVNCTAIPESLAESQLFGHKAGAFTGAQRAHDGFFRAADGGTLFLDEIGDLSLSMQPKLLRALEEKQVVPVGETRSVSFDVRVIAATHQDLEARVRDKSFRGDLYARLAQLCVSLPPLRRRREDILTLLSAHLGPHTPPMAPDLVEALLVYPWPHNIRELIAVATELRVRGAGLDELVPELVTARLQGRGLIAAEDLPPEDSVTQVEVKKPIPSKADLEGLLRLHRGNLSHVAREVGRSRMQVYRWLGRYGIDAASFRLD
jgi:DNA-binding NtrC family response regulator